MAKKKFNLDKDSLYKKIMPSSENSQNVLLDPDESQELASAVTLIQTKEVITTPDIINTHRDSALEMNLTSDHGIKTEDQSGSPSQSHPFDDKHTSPNELHNPDKDNRVFPMPINLVESVITSRIGDMLQRKGYCNCTICQQDASAIALNQLPAHYIIASTTMAMSDLYYKKHFPQIISALSQACTRVGQSPHHDRSADNRCLRNIMEELIYSKIVSSAQIKEHSYTPDCLSEVACYMLNHLPCHYAVTTKGELFAKMILLKKQYTIDSTTYLTQGFNNINQCQNP